MKKMMLALILVLGLVGCSDPHSVPTATEGVTQVFTHNNCTGYRYRGANSMSWVVCEPGQAVTTTVIENCGKGCTRERVVTTTNKGVEQ